MKIKYRILVSVLVSALLLVGCQPTSKGTTQEQKAPKTPLERIEHAEFNRQRSQMLQRINFQTPLGDQLTFGLVGFLGNMNPFYGAERSTRTLLNALYKPLLLVEYPDYQQRIRPVLLEYAEVSKDGKTIELKLKKGIKWHDGKSMTAKDIVYTLQYIAEHRDTVYLDGMQLDGREVVIQQKDELTATITLPRASTYFIDRLSEILILPEHIYRGRETEAFTPNDKEVLVGNSAYRFGKYYIHEKFNTEVVDLEYQGGSIYEEPAIKTIHYQVSANDATNRFDLMDGNMQVGQIVAGDTPAFRDENYNGFQLLDGFNVALLFKVKQDHVSTKELRSAIAHLINPAGYAGLHGVSGNVAVANSYFSPGTIHDRAIYRFYDTDTADALRQLQYYQVEHEDSELRFGFRMGEGEYSERFAIMIQESFRTQNIRLTLVPLFAEEFEAALKDPNSDVFDFCLVDYPSQQNPDAHKAMYTKGSTTNYSGYGNEELDALWDKADQEGDYLKRQVLYDEIQMALYQDLPMIPMASVKTAIEIDDRIRGVDEAVLDANRYFIYPEKLTVEEFTYTQEEIEKYEYEPKELIAMPRYDRVNILAVHWNEGKVKGVE